MALHYKRFSLELARKALEFSFKDYYRQRHRTVKAILRHKNDLVTFGTLRAYLGQAYAQSVLLLMIDQVSKSLNLIRNITPNVAENAVRLILSDFHWLSVDDIALAFERGLKSKYGPLYDRLDGQILYDWVAKYVEDRITHSAQMSQHEHEVESKSWEVLHSTNYKKLVKKR